MHIFLEIVVFLGCLVMLVFPCKESWSRLCLKFAGIMGLIQRPLYAIYLGGGVSHRSYYAYYSGVAAGSVFGIVLCLLVSRQLGRNVVDKNKKPGIPAKPNTV